MVYHISIVPLDAHMHMLRVYRPLCTFMLGIGDLNFGLGEHGDLRLIGHVDSLPICFDVWNLGMLMFDVNMNLNSHRCAHQGIISPSFSFPCLSLFSEGDFHAEC